MTWRLERRSGSAAAHHARDLDPGEGRRVELLELDRPALVLGSAQAPEVADAAAVRRAGAELVRRRSGGGAVLLVPGACTWIDVTIGRADPLWDDDVGRAFHWLGRAWRDALGDLGVPTTVHEGPLVTTSWSRLVCFAGLGPGEVVVGGRKLVGISQRRTRAGARFQCLLHRAWDPVALVELLALGPSDRARALAELERVAGGVDVDPALVAAALTGSLPG